MKIYVSAIVVYRHDSGYFLLIHSGCAAREVKQGIHGNLFSQKMSKSCPAIQSYKLLPVALSLAQEKTGSAT